MNVKETILVVDDEKQIRRLLEITLTAAGYHVICSDNGKNGLIELSTHHPSLIVLDLSLPDIDGLELLKKIRSWYYKPVIILSVRSLEEEIVSALDSGANDYITKPFRSAELLARIRVALRSENLEADSPLLRFDSLSVDLAEHSASKNGVQLKLTSTEFSILSLLARNHGRLLTHEFILREIWGNGFTDQTQYLRVFIAQLRKKIEDNPSSPKLILTESGIGYRFGIF